MYLQNVKKKSKQDKLEGKLAQHQSRSHSITQINGGNRKYNNKNNIADGFLQKYQSYYSYCSYSTAVITQSPLTSKTEIKE